jgi:hypothetical protein
MREEKSIALFLPLIPGSFFLEESMLKIVQ